MRRAGKAAAIALGASLAAGVASAATLQIVPDKTTYSVGEAVVVQLVGDSQGASEFGNFAMLRFDPAILSGESVSPPPFTSNVGGIPWMEGIHGCGSNFCVAINSIGRWYPALPVEQTGTRVWATATLRAVAPGTMTLSVVQDPHSGYQFHFFGLTSMAPVSITVVGPTIPSVGDLELAVLMFLLAAVAAWILRRRGVRT